MNNIFEKIAFFFSFWIIPLCILPKVGLLGHLKDENNLAQKDVMTCLGNTAQFSAGEKIVDNSRFRPLLQEDWAVFLYPINTIPSAGEYLFLTGQPPCRNACCHI